MAVRTGGHVYLADEWLARQFSGVRFTGLAVVFHGWELAHCEAVA